MKAIVYDKHGAPDVLAMREVEKPTPGADEVLVKIHAVALNAADYRSMRMGIIPRNRIFGSDIAGVVEAVGSDVRQFAVGDAVFGDISASGFGGFAEYAAARETLLALKPAAVPFEVAAAVPMPAVTALQGLRNPEAIQVEEGQIRPVIERRYPLRETAAAVRGLSEGHARGKVVITVP